MLHELEIRMLPGEAWWGGLVNCGYRMPLTQQSCCTVDRIVDRVPQLIAEAEQLIERLCKKEQGNKTRQACGADRTNGEDE